MRGGPRGKPPGYGRRMRSGPRGKPRGYFASPRANRLATKCSTSVAQTSQ